MLTLDVLRLALAAALGASVMACGSGCSEERVVLETTDVYEDPPKPKVLATLAMGERVVVSRLPGAPDGFVRKKGGGYVAERSVARPPLVGTARWVTAPTTAVLGGADGTTTVRTLRIGTPLSVAPDDHRVGLSLVVEDGAPVGWVATADLGTEPPVADAVVARALDAIRVIDLKAATELGRAAMTLDDRNPRARAVLGHLLSRAEPARARKLLAGLPPEPPWPATVPLSPVPGRTTWRPLPGLRAIAGSSPTLLRTAPSDVAPVAGVVPIEQALLVGLPEQGLSEQGLAAPAPPVDDANPWVFVRSTAPAMSLDAGRFEAFDLEVVEQKKPPEAVQIVVEGWVRAGELMEQLVAPARDTAKRLQMELATTEAEGLVWAHRAFAVAPDEALRKELVERALTAGRVGTAVRAARAPLVTRSAASLRQQGVATVTVDAFHGCRGEPHKAVILDAALVDETRAAAPDACVVPWIHTPSCDGDPARAAALTAERKEHHLFLEAKWAVPRLRIRFFRSDLLGETNVPWLARVARRLDDCRLVISEVTLMRLPLPAQRPAVPLDVWVENGDRVDVAWAVYLAPPDQPPRPELDSFGVPRGTAATALLPLDPCKMARCGVPTKPLDVAPDSD